MPPNPNDTKVICVTPVRNEAWILERFLRAAELWADHIIVADQGSTDGSREIATSFSKVRLIDNTADAYDEGARQRLLLAGAREIPGRRLIVALDADEVLTPTWNESEQWAAARAAEPGTVFSFDWMNLLPDGRAYVPPDKIPFAFVDDGVEHGGERIHSLRIPVGPTARWEAMRDVHVLHLQFTDWQRMKSKQRWYQCWEMLHHHGKRPVQIYRQYHRMDAFPPAEIRPVEPTWLERYAEAGVALIAPSADELLWWDEEILGWIIEHGARRFRRLDIWDVDWRRVASQTGRVVDGVDLDDPRGPWDRRVLHWLARTQDRPDRASVRWLQRMLILAGW